MQTAKDELKAWVNELGDFGLKPDETKPENSKMEKKIEKTDQAALTSSER